MYSITRTKVYPLQALTHAASAPRLSLSIEDMVLGPCSDGDDDMHLQRATATYTCKVTCLYAHCPSCLPSDIVHAHGMGSHAPACAVQDDRFRLPKRTYDNQYAQLYFCRLAAMAPRLRQRVAASWPGVPGGGCCSFFAHALSWGRFMGCPAGG